MYRAMCKKTILYYCSIGNFSITTQFKKVNIWLLYNNVVSPNWDYTNPIDFENVEISVNGTQVIIKGLDCDWLEYDLSNGQLYFANARFIRPLVEYISEGTATFDGYHHEINVGFTYAIQDQSFGLADGKSVSYTVDMKKGEITREINNEDFSAEHLKEIAHRLYSIFEYIEGQKVYHS